MKILFVTPHFPPSLGGVELYVFNLARGLQQTYHAEVVVVTSNAEANKLTVGEYDGIKVYRLPVMVRISNTPLHPLWYFTLKKIIQGEKPDIINSHQPVPFLGDLAALLAGNIPFVLTYHAGTMKKQAFLSDILIFLYETCILPQTAKKATRIICVSHFVANTLLKMHLSKIAIVSPGVHTSLYKPDATMKRAENRVLFAAYYKKMYKMKGLYSLIDAINQLDGITLRVVGEKDECSSPNIEFVGVKQGKALVEEMQQASVLVLPSVAPMESFGMVLIEAMACQTPVIGTNMGGIPEVITENVDGCIVPPGDSHALALAISKIIKDKDVASRMGQAGAAKVSERFTWEKCVEKTKEIFASCMK